MINILHLTPWSLGGATSYVVNLAKVFEFAGVPHRVVRLSKRTEKTKREIGNYGVHYQNVSIEDASAGLGVWLLASAPTDRQLAAYAVHLVERSKGAYVFHDPNEFGMYPHWETADQSRVICIRETGLDSMPQGKFIPHPYLRMLEDDYGPRPCHAISIARISGVKNSLWILEANQVLDDDKRVNLAGSLNRFWWNFNVKPKYPKWPMPEGKGFPRLADAAARACVGYNYMVDLTIFKNDGGGTQYSFLEAMDAGAVPVMTTDWCSYKGVAGKLGFQVHDRDDLVKFLADDSSGIARETKAYRKHNYSYLQTTHSPVDTALAYKRYLGVTRKSA